MDAYKPLADGYRTLTADYDYDRWLEVIEGLATDAGLRGNRLLDVACGTGSSFLPLCDRYDVVACDLSPAMLEHAAARAAGRKVRLLRHDMRTLPVLGEFDLVLCLDDSLNHLLDVRDVRAALRGIAANLSEDGVAVFDLNTLAALRAGTDEFVAEDEEYRVEWRGSDRRDLPVGGRLRVEVDVISRSNGRERRRTTLTERHYPVAEFSQHLAAAGLEAVQVLGQSPGVRLEPRVDELRHHKALFVARRSTAVAAQAA